MPNLRVKRQDAIRALAAEVRKITAHCESELEKYPSALEAKREQIVAKLEKVTASIASAKTAESIQAIINNNDLGYSWRKDIPAKPSNGSCQHARMLKQLQMDTREIIPVGEKDVLWNLLVAKCGL